MKALILFFLFSVALMPAALAGNEGRGTEDSVLIGLALKMRMSPGQLADFEQRKETLKELIMSPKWRERIYSFAEQVSPDKLSTYVSQADRDVYNKMQAGGLLNDIKNTQFQVLDSCPDVKNENRSAATHTVLLWPICFDVEKIALLELVQGLSDYAGHFDLLFGITMHEFARHFDEDDDHTFLLAMAAEPTRQNVIEFRECPASSNICPTGRGDNTYAVDLSISPHVQVNLDISSWVSSKVKKGVTQWKADYCAKYDTLEFPDLDAVGKTQNPKQSFSQKMIPIPENKIAQGQFDYQAQGYAQLQVQVVNGENNGYPNWYNEQMARFRAFQNMPPGFSMPMGLMDMPPGPFNYPCGNGPLQVTLIDSSGHVVWDGGSQNGNQSSSNVSVTLKFFPWSRPQGFGPLQQ